MGTSLPTPVRPVRMQKSTSEDLTYVPTDGFIGTDRLQAFVQSQRLQAASEQTQSAQLNMTIQVQLQEPRVFEDSVTDPSIEIHDLKTLAPSGVPLASALTENDGSSRTCLRALEPYTWINESLSTQHFGQTDQILGTLRSHVIDMTIPRMPCDLWLLINSNGTSMEQLSCEDEGCTLRPAHMADQCLTFITGPVSALHMDWELVGTAFDYTSLAGSNGRFCVQTLNGLEGCFDTLVMEVISQLYYGRPTYTPLVVGVPPLNCSGFVDMMALPEENLTLNENVTDFQLARDRCMGSLSCEYIFDPVGIIDPAPDCIKELVVNYTCPNHEMFQSSTLVYPGQEQMVTDTDVETDYGSEQPSSPTSPTSPTSTNTEVHIRLDEEQPKTLTKNQKRQLEEELNELGEQDQAMWSQLQSTPRRGRPVTFLPSVEPLAVHGSLGSGSFLLQSSIDMRRLRQLTSCPSPEINATLPMESFETLVDGAPVALSEFAQHLRYLPASHWSGSEPVRLMLTAADDPSVVHGTAESWAVVERKNDHPNITAHQLEFQVATSIGRLYLDPSFLLAPLGTLEPLQGRLDGDFALRVRGSGHDLQAFVDNLRFASEAPAKPSLATRPLNASETEAIISYVLSDTITPQAGALRRHQVAGKVVDPETDEPVQGVEVVLIAQDTWHDYLGYNLATGCSRELLGWTVADCKSYAEQQGHPGFTYGLSSTGGAQACCFKSEDVDLILMNLVADLNVNVYIFQPGGYFVRTTTSALGMYTALMPTGPADIYFTKALRNTRNLSIVVTGNVNDNIQVGGAADIYLPALNVVTIWRFEVDWISTAPVDLDAHAFDAWNCHVYFANRLCQHDGSHGLTVTLTRSSRDLLIGKEIITVHQWPCDSTQATIGGYRDIWSCSLQRF
ncbi:unnamed protein product [Durusdinium trenchii]|uniref:Uncharacterized protein n=1 Tax=Durusdinium trenchii TaxID=1381693 RepID=A0ABP0Q4K2_9DINO